MLEYAVLFAATYLVWKLLRALYRSAPLDNLPGPSSHSWLTGHLLQLFDRQGWDFLLHLEARYGPVCKLQGMFGQTMLYIYDPLALQSIVAKDPPISDHVDWYLKVILDSFGPGLVSTTGETHRKQRKILSPVFSNKNLRRVTPVVHEVARRLKEAIESIVDSGASDVDVSHYMGRAALEVAGQAVLGQALDPLTEQHPHPYAEAIHSYTPALSSLSRYIPLYRFARPLIPAPLRRPVISCLPSTRLKNLVRIVDTMHALSAQIYAAKKKAVESLGSVEGEDGGGTKDFVSVLLRANAGASLEEAMSEEEMVAQITTIVFGTTDTTSTSLVAILECLAEHPQAQEKLRGEIVNAKSLHEGGEIPYDTVMSLPYLDAVCKESLRVCVSHRHVYLERAIITDATLPLSKPVRGRDGAMVHAIPVTKGLLVFVPVQSSNVSPELWGTDARVWRPERWLEPLPKSVTDAKIPGVYSHIMTFWGGGRSCIGFTFAQLIIKFVLIELIPTFKFAKTNKSVIWNIGEVIYPTVGTNSLHPAYPMEVTLVKPERAAVTEPAQ
ncbi:cytochrome P450 [Trametes cingulata]|nr:cytochrome P450 [Trametes cingulata]